MFRGKRNPIGVLSGEVDISVRRITHLTENPFLSPNGVRVLTQANEFAREVFDGPHGLTANGYIVPLPRDKKALPHPCIGMTLDVGECVSGLTRLRVFLRSRVAYSMTFSTPPYLHFHRSDGRAMEVTADRYGIRLN